MTRPLSPVELAILEDAADIAAQWSPLLYGLEHGAADLAEAEAESAMKYADTLFPEDLS